MCVCVIILMILVQLGGGGMLRVCVVVVCSGVFRDVERGYVYV